MSVAISSAECVPVSSPAQRSAADTMRALLSVGVGVAAPAPITAAATPSSSPPLPAKKSSKLSFSVDSLLSTPASRRGSPEQQGGRSRTPGEDVPRSDAAVVFHNESALNLRLQSSPMQLTVRTPAMVNGHLSPPYQLHTPPQSPLSCTVMTPREDEQYRLKMKQDSEDSDRDYQSSHEDSRRHDEDSDMDDIDVDGGGPELAHRRLREDGEEAAQRGRSSRGVGGGVGDHHSENSMDSGSEGGAEGSEVGTPPPSGSVPPLFPQPLHPTAMSMMMARRGAPGWSGLPNSLAAHFAWMPNYPPNSSQGGQYSPSLLPCCNAAYFLLLSGIGV